MWIALCVWNCEVQLEQAGSNYRILLRDEQALSVRIKIDRAVVLTSSAGS